MKLPNAERAVKEMRKLSDYCLNPSHDEGKHKARLFAAALGMTAHDAAELRTALYRRHWQMTRNWDGGMVMDNVIP